MKWFVLMLLFCVVDSPSLAIPTIQDTSGVPQLIVTGADKPVEVGGLVRLKASLKNKPKEIVSFRVQWFKIENNNLNNNDLDISADSMQAISGTGKDEGKLNFILIPIFEYNDGKTDTLQVPPGGTQISVVIKNSVNPKPPEPPQPPLEVPSFPAGEYNFAQVFAVLLFNETSLTNEQKVKLARGLSLNSKKIVDRICTDQTYRNFTQILTDTGTGNAEVFSSLGFTEKNTPLRTAMNHIISNAYNGGSGKLVNASEVVVAWREAIIGFDWIANNLK